MLGPDEEPIEVAGLTISRTLVPHPLLGEAHTIASDGRVLTHMTSLDWDRPTQIPAIAAPGALPAGTGAAIMNLIAERAIAASVHTLRYAGPYPTPALYRTLLRSFRASHDEQAFTRDLIARAASLARTEVGVDFTPAPHRRISHEHGVSEVRDGLEHTTIDGDAFNVRNVLPTRLVRLAGPANVEDVESAASAAEVWFGDRPYARVAVMSAEGMLLDGPHPIPRVVSSVLGTAFPPPLRAALGELIADLVPSPLADAAQQIVAASDIRWTDLGARVARTTDDAFEVHAAIWEHIAPLGMARLALALAEALAPVVTGTLVRRLLSDPSVRPSP